MADYVIKQGDTGPDIEATLSNADGAENLSGASVKCIIRPTSGGAAIVDAAASIVEAASGTVKYVLQEGDTDDAGDYLVEWEVTFSGGTIQTYPNDGYQTLLITRELG